MKLRLIRELLVVVAIYLGLLSGARAASAETEEDGVIKSMLLGSLVRSMDPSLEQGDDPGGFAVFLRRVPIDQERFVCLLGARNGLTQAIGELLRGANRVGIPRRAFEEQFNKSLAIAAAAVPGSDAEAEPFLAGVRERLRQHANSPLPDDPPRCRISAME